MATPQSVDSVAPGGVVNLSDAPSGLDDATFDSLFPAEPAPLASPAPQPVAQPASTPAPVTADGSTTNAPFIKGDKSVYNTPEAAVQGINQKDALIEQLRQRYALTTGVDPITGQPVAQIAQPQPQGVDYANSADKYMSDLYAAAKSGDPNAYSAVQTKYIMDTLKPLQPVMQRAAREQALDIASNDIKEIPSFIGTPQYKATLDSVPELRDAIQTAEQDHRFHNRLPGLYKIAYLAGQGQQLPQILATQAAQARTTNPPAQPRPTAQPSTPSMPQEGPKPSFKDIHGIKAIVAAAEARGAKLDF